MVPTRSALSLAKEVERERFCWHKFTERKGATAHGGVGPSAHQSHPLPPVLPSPPPPSLLVCLLWQVASSSATHVGRLPLGATGACSAATSQQPTLPPAPGLPSRRGLLVGSAQSKGWPGGTPIRSCTACLNCCQGLLRGPHSEMGCPWVVGPVPAAQTPPTLALLCLPPAQVEGGNSSRGTWQGGGPVPAPSFLRE